MLMHFTLAESVVVQVIEAGVRESRVERSKIGQVKGIVMAVVDAREKTHEASRLARRRILADCGLDNFKRRPRAFHDGFNAVLERGGAVELLAADDFSPSLV